MPVERLAYADTGRFARPVIDHLANDPFIREFLDLAPDHDGLRRAAERVDFDPAKRAVLCAAMEEQHAALDPHPSVRENLRRLRDPRALTITTGHQLCLFTGPLYVPYKILNAIRLAREASQLLQRPVVPVFWMATEDHDAAEIDHAVINDRTIRWPGAGGGPVGRMPLRGIAEQVEEAIAALGPGESTAHVAHLLREAYREDRTLAEATRLFVHALFGHLGLLIVDGDDPALKRLFAPTMTEELLNQITQRTVTYANERIKERYAVQAHAREINLFHLRTGQRSRITMEDAHFQVLDGGPRWLLDELLTQVQEHPEAFSPNVLLRPVYQATVLPDIAYIGGGGELAYWIQLRWLFQALQVPMPAFFLRTSAATLSAKHRQQWEGMGLGARDLFHSADTVKAEVASRTAGFRTDLEQEKAGLKRLYASVSQLATAADGSLKGSVAAREQQAIRGLERIEKGLLRAAKHDQAVAMQRIEAIHEALFPAGGLQERRDSFLPVLAAHGLAAVENWMEILDPLDPTFVLVSEP